MNEPSSPHRAASPQAPALTGLRWVTVGWAVLLIRLYQKTLSPLFGDACRFTPSCSRYAETSLRRFGLLRGGWLAARRLVRCQPWGGAGYDPVPVPVPAGAGGVVPAPPGTAEEAEG